MKLAINPPSEIYLSYVKMVYKNCIGYTCVPQDIFITITHTGHIIIHSSLPSIHYITWPLPSATLIYLSCPWMINVPSFGVISTHGFAHNLALLLVHEHISCWGVIHQAERFKIMPFLNHDQSFVSHQCILYEIAHMFIFHKNKWYHKDLILHQSQTKH